GWWCLWEPNRAVGRWRAEAAEPAAARPPANAECGVRNAECQWRPPVVSDLFLSIPHSEFRIPNCAFRIQLNALSPVISWPKMSVDRKSTRLNSSHQIISY